MKILKRNQIIISVIALMLITVGYMNFTSNLTSTVETGALINAETMAGIGDARLVNSNDVVKQNDNYIENTENESNEIVENSTYNIDNLNKNIESNSDIDEKEKIGTSVSSQDSDYSEKSKETSASGFSSDYFITSKLERDKMYSQILETYEGILKNDSIASEQKALSTQEIANINSKKNSIMIAENLIKNLGFEDVVIFVNENSVSVIVKSEKLDEASVAQIQNIVCREIGVENEKIHISLK